MSMKLIEVVSDVTATIKIQGYTDIKEVADIFYQSSKLHAPGSKEENLLAKLSQELERSITY